MTNKTLYDLGILAQKGDKLALLEIIERKKQVIKRNSYGNEDLYQFILLKIMEGIKNYNFS